MTNQTDDTKAPAQAFPNPLPFPITTVMNGQTAMVPLPWLVKLLTAPQINQLVTRRAVRHTRQRKATRSLGSRRGNGVYVATHGANARKTVRGERLQQVFAIIKARPDGVTPKELRSTLKVSQPTLWRALGELEQRRAVSFQHAGQ